jgi:hypothetical protein
MLDSPFGVPGSGGEPILRGWRGVAMDDCNELVGRFLAHVWPLHHVDVGLGQLAPPFGVTVPIPAASRVLGSIERKNAHDTKVDSYIEVSLSSEKALAWFSQELAKRTWTLEVASRTRPPGFVPREDRDHLRFSSHLGSGYISFREASPSTTNVLLHWDGLAADPAHSGRRGADIGHISLLQEVPVLAAPEGAELRPGGGCGGTDWWYTEAVATTSASCTELEAHFGKQLEAAGWTIMDRDGDQRLAWSDWSKTNQSKALLLVVPITAKQRLMSLRIRGGHPLGAS